MTNTLTFFLLCPVPEDQKPLNEYIGLKENLLTSWTTLSTPNYQKTLRGLFFRVFFVLSLLHLYGLQSSYYLVEWIIQNLWWTITFLLSLLSIILSRWAQVNRRFLSARLVYEEASWYDGQVWEKPLSLIKNDTFISSQKIQPIIQRIQNTMTQLVALNLLLFFGDFFFL